MKRLKRLVYYLLINMLVSACTTLSVLALWQRYSPNPIDLSLVTRPTPTGVVSSVNLERTEGLPTTTPQPLITYAVQAGDTLGGIALEFDTSVAELIQLNALADPENLGIGQVLFVPAPATPTADPAQTRQPEEITPTPAGGAVIVNVFGVGDLATERVRLAQAGPGPLALLGWALVDETGVTYMFPDLALYPGGWVDVYSGGGANGIGRLYWGRNEAVWQPGEEVRLLDPAGDEHASFTIPQ